jgi:hypothetical protein
MKTLALLALLFTGCAHTDLYSKGVRVAHMEGDMTGMTFRYHADGSIDLMATRVSHSTATRAGTDAITKTGTAILTSGLVGVIPK